MKKGCRLQILLIVVLIGGLGTSLSAQQDWSWVFGDSILMRFPGGGPPVVDPVYRSRFALENTTCISDMMGNLRYYVTKDSIFRADGTRLTGGWQLYGDDITNGLQILPVWGDTTNYLVFFISVGCNGPISYCPWLAELKGPLGQDQIVTFRNLGQYHPTRPLAEKLSAVRDASGTGWWVLAHGIHDNNFIRFKVDGNQVSSLSLQPIGSMHETVGSNPFLTIGEMCFSPQGDKLLVVSNTGIVDVFDFDRCSGQLSNWDSLGTPAAIDPGPNEFYGCSFSPDGTKVYASEVHYLQASKLWQWDLTAPDIRASKTLIFTSQDSLEMGQHQLGPDGKIYISQEHRWDTANVGNYNLSVINDPNQTGVSCNFAYANLYLEGLRCTYGLPNLPNFNLPPMVAQVAEAGPPQAVICQGDSFLIGYPDTTGGAVTFAWSAAAGLSYTSQPQQWVAPTSSTWYYLTVVDSIYGVPCGITHDSIHVIVADSSIIPIANAGIDTTICTGDSVLIGTSGNPYWNYSWSPTGQNSSQIQVNRPGTYTLIVSSPIANLGCLADTDIVVVDTFAILPNPPATDTTICRGDSLVLGMPLTPSWVGNWSPSAGLIFPDSAFTLAYPQATTTYTLYATDTSNPGGCATLRDTVHVRVEEPFVHPIPESQAFCPGEILTVGVGSVSAFSYEWSPVTGLQNPYVSATTVAPLTPITYTLAITSDTMRSENCKTQYFPVALTSEGCLMQNVVTPNGDGLNDFLILGTFNGPISLSIYDRWGALVYASSGYKNDWPPSNSNLPETVYYYVLKVANEGGKEHVGEIMVLR